MMVLVMSKRLRKGRDKQKGDTRLVENTGTNKHIRKRTLALTRSL